MPRYFPLMKLYLCRWWVNAGKQITKVGTLKANNCDNQRPVAA